MDRRTQAQRRADADRDRLLWLFMGWAWLAPLAVALIAKAL